MAGKERQNESLPACVTEYTNLVVRKIKYRRKVRQEVRQELTDHFTDALAEYQTEEQRQQAAEKLIADFGDPKTLARLIRRGKKRCRPLWKKAVIRFLQCLPLLYAALVLYNIWIIHTWRTHEGDFMEKFNQVSRPVVKEETNAWQHYQKAANLYVALPKEYDIITTSNYEELDEPAKEALRKWIVENEPAWQEVVQGTRLPYCWTEFQTDQTPAKNLDDLIKSLGKFRALARMGGWRVRCDITDNRGEEALEECIVVVKMGRHILSHQLLVEKLNGTALSSVGYAFIKEVLSKSQVELKKLAQTQQALEDLPVTESLMDMQGEVYYSLAFLEEMIQVTQRNPLKWLIPAQVVLTGSVQETESKLTGLYDMIGRETPYQMSKQKEKDTNSHSDMSPSRYINLHVKLSEPALTKINELFYRVKTRHAATITILALHRWRLEIGAFPEKLEKLVTEGYLRQLPKDSYSDGILRYERREEDFILYSVGEDFADSGGVETWDHGSHQGDWILWPISQ